MFAKIYSPVYKQLLLGFLDFFGKLLFLGTLNCKVENSLDLNFEKNSGIYPTDIAPNVSP